MIDKTQMYYTWECTFGFMCSIYTFVENLCAKSLLASCHVVAKTIWLGAENNHYFITDTYTICC